MIHIDSILFFIITLALMGFFAGFEMAFYSANRLSFEISKKEAGSASQVLDKFLKSPARFLGATLVGFQIFLVFLGLQISNVMEPVWQYVGVASATVRIVAEIGFITFVVLIFAEFIPRAFFRARANNYLLNGAHVIDFFYQMFAPVAVLFIDLAEWILKYIINVRVDKNKEPINRSDLRHLFGETDLDERQERNTQLMENAQELPKVKIRQCLVPRKEIIGIDIRSTVEAARKKFIDTRLSKLVVFENNIDHIRGYIHQLDLFKGPATVADILLPIPAVPESMSATDLIGKFTRERKSIAWVVDEFGGTAGIITMEDVLEELFGEIEDEYDTEEFVEKQLADNEYMFSGRLEIDYLEDKYGFEFGEGESETLSGFIIHHHETIPRQKERIFIGDYEFEIMNVSDTRIETVKMKKLK